MEREAPSPRGVLGAQGEGGKAGKQYPGEWGEREGEGKGGRGPGVVAWEGETGRRARGWGVRQFGGWGGAADAAADAAAARRTTGAGGGGPAAAGLVPTLPPQLRHLYMVVNPQHRADALRRALYALAPDGLSLGFMNWQQRLKDAAAKAAAKKIQVCGLMRWR